VSDRKMFWVLVENIHPDFRVIALLLLFAHRGIKCLRHPRSADSLKSSSVVFTIVSSKKS